MNSFKNKRSFASISLAFVILVCLSISQCALAEASDDTKLSIFISNGDNHWLAQRMAVDSKESIEAAFEFMKDVGVKRVYWRGIEEIAWIEYQKERRESVQYYPFWQWIRQIYKTIDPDKIAVDAAHKNGIEIWGVANIMDWGVSADFGCGDFYPHQAEAVFRVEHPEWVPVDKYGVRKQGGPIELAYPEARKMLVDMHVKYAKASGYDGMTTLTYTEQFSMRNEDEFGFNEPIVKEYRRRYGVDICKEPFHKYYWHRLRGEYLTEFFRDVRQKLNKAGIKLGVFINPFDKHYTQKWPHGGEYRFNTAGPIFMDIETWIDEGIFDEFEVWGASGRQLATVDELLYMTEGTPIEVIPFTSQPRSQIWSSARKRGFHIMQSQAEEYRMLDNCLDDQPLSALKGQEKVMQMKVLSQIILGKTSAKFEDVAPLAKHDNLIMRRLALGALAKIGDVNAVPIIEEALFDSENGVRCAAAMALKEVHGPDSAARIFEAVDRCKYGIHPLAEAAHLGLSTMVQAKKGLIIKTVKSHPNPTVRKVAIRLAVGNVIDDVGIWAYGNITDKDMIEMLKDAVLNDSSPDVGKYAAFGLGYVENDSEVVEVLIKATEKENPMVSDTAARALGMIAARNEESINPLRPKMLAALEKLFAKLGDGCKRADAEWGYRPVGNALVAMGEEGQAILKKFMNQKEDFKLAEQAWKSLYIRQRPHPFWPVTEEENAEAFKKRPEWVRKVHEQRQFKLD
ncbi:MAG: HEAT repeat domain-containing protein [Sedimentisphaerales bacterium]|nr:HEAT repeat domain-containing protein [Sedimentisphaerales bacterium]